MFGNTAGEKVDKLGPEEVALLHRLVAADRGLAFESALAVG